MKNKYNKKGIVFLPILIVLVIAIIILVILIKAPTICILGNCFRLVPLRWGKALMFWLMFISFFLVVGGMIYAYYWILSKGIIYGRTIIEFIKIKTLNIEQYFMKITD